MVLPGPGIPGLSNSAGNSSGPLFNNSLTRTRPSFSSPLKGGDEKDEFATGAPKLVLEDETDEKDEFAPNAAFWLSGEPRAWPRALPLRSSPWRFYVPETPRRWRAIHEGSVLRVRHP